MMSEPDRKTRHLLTPVKPLILSLVDKMRDQIEAITPSVDDDLD